MWPFNSQIWSFQTDVWAYFLPFCGIGLKRWNNVIKLTGFFLLQNPKITFWLLQFIFLGGTDWSIPISHWTGLDIIWLHTIVSANPTQIHRYSYLNAAEKWPIPAAQVDKSVSDGVAKMANRIGVSLLQQPNSWVLRYNH